MKKNDNNNILKNHPIRKNSGLADTDYEKQIIRSERSLQKDYEYYYRYFNKLCNTIPAYIQKNLKKMPNNKGYIWKGLQCFGELPADNNYNNTMLFENVGRDTLHIHEWTATEYKVYEKHGKNNKVLIKKENRRIIQGNVVY